MSAQFCTKSGLVWFTGSTATVVDRNMGPEPGALRGGEDGKKEERKEERRKEGEGNERKHKVKIYKKEEGGQKKSEDDRN